MTTTFAPTPFRLPRFYPILDTAVLAARGCPVSIAAEALLHAGVRILQYRHKADWTQGHFQEAQQIGKLCEEAGVLFVLNDRADYAQILRCALHLGQEDLTPTAARKVIADEIIGYSTHNVEQLKAADSEPAEYLSIGPIFDTTSKLRPDPVVGIEGLKEARSLTKKPLCAIGGLTLDNAGPVLAAKADSLAVIAGWLPAKCDKKTIKNAASEWLDRTAGQQR